jgi:DtxR family Mn-dependent transcriptional regulator
VSLFICKYLKRWSNIFLLTAKTGVVITLPDEQKFHTVRGYQMLEQNKRRLTSAMEDYLEMIYRHCLKESYLRINTLSELLNVQASSSTKMVQRLARLGLLQYEKYGLIFLTESGREVGKFLLERHRIMETFLGNLGVVENILLETELIEHNVSPGTLRNFELMNKFLEAHPKILEEFRQFKKGTTYGQ